MSKGTGLIALAVDYQDGTTVRGKIPAPVVKALRANEGDVLAFERRTDGAVIVRKATAAERKPPVKPPVSKKGARK